MWKWSEWRSRSIQQLSFGFGSSKVNLDRTLARARVLGLWILVGPKKLSVRTSHYLLRGLLAFAYNKISFYRHYQCTGGYTLTLSS
jgi:hypothetical protein